MKIAVHANDTQKNEWNQKEIPGAVEVLWCGSVRTLVATTADVYMDLAFEPDPERMQVLHQRASFPFFINSVEFDSSVIGNKFIRINAWPGFLKRAITEIAITDGTQEKMVSELFDELKWKYQLAPDIPGMISARIIASIINEAYFTFGDGTSSKEEIDIAMKLGTSYPMGPFEWADYIGLDKIGTLLYEMYKHDKRYKPAPALESALNLFVKP